MVEKEIVSMVENGAIIYLDGNKVELQKIDIFQYHIEKKDGNIILSSK